MKKETNFYSYWNPNTFDSTTSTYSYIYIEAVSRSHADTLLMDLFSIDLVEPGTKDGWSFIFNYHEKPPKLRHANSVYVPYSRLAHLIHSR